LKKKAIRLIKELTEASGASGCEQQVAKIFINELKENLSTDRNGSIICESKGTESSPAVMLEAHMDEVGFMVQAITPEGYLKFIGLGGWWGHALLAHRVRVLTRDENEIIGVITSKPPHFLGKEERGKVLKIEDMHIDVGAGSSGEVINDFGINVGDSIVPDTQFTPMRNADYMLSKAFDNRIGLALAIQATQKLRTISHPNTVYTVGTVQEEVGVRGAITAVQAVNPDVAIVLEGPPADDVPGANLEVKQAILNHGVQIRLMDSSAIMHRAFSLFAIDVAEKCSISHQVAVRNSGGTDAKAIQIHGAGVPAIVLGVPARYIHTHNSIVHLNDYISALNLVMEILERLNAATVSGFTDYIRKSDHGDN
jgi:putative aminopeptidase FrvX